MKEKTADEMFEELDYLKLNTEFLGYRKSIDYCEIEIFFNDMLKNYYIYTGDDEFTVSVPLHKAITKKMEELRWL